VIRVRETKLPQRFLRRFGEFPPYNPGHEGITTGEQGNGPTAANTSDEIFRRTELSGHATEIRVIIHHTASGLLVPSRRLFEWGGGN